MIVNPVMYGGGSALKTVTMSRKRSTLTIYYIDENGTLQTESKLGGSDGITISVPARTTIISDTSDSNMIITGAVYAGRIDDVSSCPYLYYVEP